jgi:phage baseplate assembly protein W
MSNGPAGDGPRFLDFPFHIGPEGGAARTTANDHVRDLIEQVLFTNPGERVNLPEFGCGLRNLVFAGNNEVLRATVQFIITQNLNRWLADVLSVVEVKASPEEETLVIEITYSLKRTLERQQVTLRL